MSESEPTLIQQAEARHQQVRELVERKYPDCRVRDIRESVRTEYKRPYRNTKTIDEIMAALKDDEPWVLARFKITYEVEAISMRSSHPSVRCRVHVTNDGSLRIHDTESSFVFYMEPEE